MKQTARTTRALPRRQVMAMVTAGSGAWLAACGGGGAQEARPSQGVSCRGPIQFVSPWNVGSGTGDGLNDLGRDFAAAHPGCSAELLYVPGGNTAILEKLVAALAGGDPPPVALVPAQQTPLWISKGVIQPLDSLAKRDGIGKEQFFAGYWPQMVVDGTLWRLPFSIDVNFPWFLNKQSFLQAGIPAEVTPKTIDEVDRLATALTRGSPGAHEQFGLVPWQLYGHVNSLQSWAYAFGGEFWDQTKDQVIANDPKTVAALEWMVSWARRLGGYDAVEAELTAMGGWDRGFAEGKLGMAVQTSNGLRNSKQVNPALSVTGGLFPGNTGVQPGAATWLSGRGIGMVRGASNPEAAWAFVKWVGATKDGTLAAVNRVNATPGLKASPGLEVLEKDPESKPFVDALRAAKHNPPGALLPINVWANGRGDLIKEALQQKIPARQALDEVARTAQLELEAERARQKR